MMKYEAPYLSILELEEGDVVTASKLQVGTSNDADTTDWSEIGSW